MNTMLKSLILAAAGTALIAASSASAQTNTRSLVRRDPPAAVQNFLPRPDTELWRYGEINVNPSVDPFGQIRDEYLKDGPTHNGNAY